MLKRAQDDELVMSLVEAALAQPLRERKAYVQQACSDNTELFSQVWGYVESEERMNGFMLEPFYRPDFLEHPFEPGQLLDGRFRIIREVARGGMGIVYEAQDEKLERRIALKCAKAGFGKRLPPEVRTASEISHPNVCKIFEIHTAATENGDVDFLTMEFLEGETLADKLRDGPLPEEKARTIARQLCAGLAEAHRNRVIHGDLKSNNVILTTSSDGSVRAVITDFGLAQRPENRQRTVQSGPLEGTPDYMAPELWKGEKASVASDIYALGVILYELISGYRPESCREIRTDWELPAVHPKWDRILRHCLHPDAIRRYRKVDELAQALTPRSRRWFVSVIAAAVLAVLSSVVTYQRATAPQETVRLAVLPFQAYADTMTLAGTVSRDVSKQISQLQGSARTKLVVLPISSALNNKVTTAERAKTVLAATHVLYGRLYRDNDKVIVQAYLLDVRSQNNAKELREAYSPGEVRYLPMALAGMITSTLRLPAAGPPTVNIAANHDYVAGMSYLRRNSGVDSAIAYMERAVANDPDSALTHAGLAEAQWWKYWITKDPVWKQRAKESVQQARRRNPDLAQVHRISGMLKSDAGYYELALSDFRRALELEPHNGDTYRRLGTAYEHNSEFDEALIAFRRAIAEEPDNYRNHQALGSFYYQRANYDEALKHLVKTVELAHDEPNAHFALGTAYMNVGRFAEAENSLRYAINLGENPSALHSLGLVLMYEERDREAIPFFQRALEKSPERFLSWIHLATACRRIGRRIESEKANQRGLALAETEVLQNPRKGRIRAQLAYLCASLKDRRRAESEAAQALQLSPNEADTQWWAVLTYELLGRRDATLDTLTAAPRELLSDLSRWPDLSDLHNDARFQQLLRYQAK